MEKNQFLFLTSLFRTRWGGGKGPLKFEIDCSHSMVKCRNWCRKKGRLCEIPIEGASQNIQPHNRTWLKCTDSSKVSKRNTNHILCKRKKISNKPEQAYEQPSNMAGFNHRHRLCHGYTMNDMATRSYKKCNNKQYKNNSCLPERIIRSWFSNQASKWLGDWASDRASDRASAMRDIDVISFKPEAMSIFFSHK